MIRREFGRMKATRGMKRSVTIAVLTASFLVLSGGVPAAAVDWMIYVRESDGKRVVKHTDEQWYVADADGLPDPAQPVAVGGITIDFTSNTAIVKNYSFHMGANNLTAGLNSIALGAGNNASSALSPVAVGSSNHATGLHSVALGTSNWATGSASIAIGFSSQASGDLSVAMGNLSEALWHSTAVGYFSKALGLESVAVGSVARASGKSSIALGLSSKALGERSVAVGPWSEAGGEDSTALGHWSAAAAKGATALGHSSRAIKENGVALGAFSHASVEAGVVGYDPTGARHSNDTTGTWKSTMAAVSVGNAGNVYTRQITNVAAGSEDTDAANVAQLKAVVKTANKQIATIHGQLGELRGDIRETGASAAALAGLKPMQYDPMEPSQFMLGAGHYRGDWAVALGLSHYPSENFLIHAGVAFGGDHAMLNAGMTWKFGDGGKKAELPERYRKGPISSVYVMQQENIQLQEKVEEQDRRIAQLDQENAGIRAENAEIKTQNAAIMAENAEIKAQLAAITKTLNMK